MIGWLVYSVVILAASGLVGLHLGRFREAYTEMTGMMAGMTMGMLNGFVLGFAAASATNSMFWGDLFGIVLGLTMGIYFGRTGGLMGIMDGGMGGVMGGSMGAMLSVMLAFPSYALFWTAVLLTILYALGMVGLVVLIEQSAPGHAALHRLAPFFSRAIAREVDEVVERAQPPEGKVVRVSQQKRVSRRSTSEYAPVRKAQSLEVRRDGSRPISWVGGAALLIILLALGWWALAMGSRINLGASSGSGSGLAKLGVIKGTTSTKNLHLSLSLSPDPPVAGPTDFTVQVKDQAGQPVTGAQIRWSMDMTNMNMGPQGGQMAEAGSGKYQARGAFSMGGPWRISVQVGKDGQALGSASFDLQVR